MFNRIERLLRLACLLIAAAVLLQFIRIGFKRSSLDDVKIPEVPTYGTTNTAKADSKSTNSVAVAQTAKGSAPGTNALAKGTNSAPSALTNAVGTNVVAVEKGSNAVTVAAGPIKGTNQPGTNVLAGATPPKEGRPMSMPQGGSPGPSTPGKKASDLSPEMQARIDKIVKSELLAPVVRPLPMALFGIAGNTAFLRGPNGQTGVVKEGDELGGIKLLKIGFNRVLVEQDGEKKELMVFQGMGGESLLTNEKKELSK